MIRGLLILAAFAFLAWAPGCASPPQDFAPQPTGGTGSLNSPYSMNAGGPAGPFILPQTNNFRHYDKDDY